VALAKPRPLSLRWIRASLRDRHQAPTPVNPRCAPAGAAPAGAAGLPKPGLPPTIPNPPIPDRRDPGIGHDPVSCVALGESCSPPDAEYFHRSPSISTLGDFVITLPASVEVEYVV
jgi:hypothetical protein